MTTIRIDLPDPIARNAKEAGLLEPKILEALLSDELIRRRAMNDLLEIAERASRGERSSSEEEIRAVVQGEIDRYRAEKRNPGEGRR
jgi:hypothetical protein